MLEVFETLNDKIDLVKRMDFNFWSPRENLDQSIEFIPLKECVGNNSLTTSAFYPSITPFYQKLEDNKDDLMPFIRVGDTRKALLEYKDTVFLNTELLDALSKNIKRVNPGDVVITKGGEYIGEATLVPNYYGQYAICRDVLAIKSGDSCLTGEYLASFFQSKLGKSELIRTKSVQGQPHLTLEKIYDINIPIFDEIFQEEIKEYWDAFFELINESKDHLQRAKEVLNIAMKNRLSQSQKVTIFEMELNQNNLTQRCDFEYYEKKWSNLISDLSKDGMTFHPVKYIKQDIDTSDVTKIYNYVTLTDIDDRSGMIRKYRKIPVYNLPDRAKRATQLGDVLVSSLKGSRDKVAIIEEDKENLVASTGFYIIRDENLTPEVLYLLFRSDFYTLFIEQMASGSIMSSITEKYFKQLVLPDLDQEIQRSITQEIQSYFNKRKDAFTNLESAIEKFDEMLNKLNIEVEEIEELESEE